MYHFDLSRFASWTRRETCDTKRKSPRIFLVTCLRKFSDDAKLVGFEAGALTQYLTYELQAAGYEVICL